MATLITLAQARVPAALQRKLTPVAPVLYLPFTALVSQAFDQRVVQTAPLLIVTSDAGANALVQVADVRQHPVVCLSSRLKLRLQKAGFTRIQVAKAENRAATFALVGRRRAVWLTGDRSPQAPENIARIIAYRSRWRPQDARNAATIIAQATIDAAIVSSPSSWRHLRLLVRKRQAQFAATRWYTLGTSTALTMQADGLAAIPPKTTQAVLQQAVTMLRNDAD